MRSSARDQQQRPRSTLQRALRSYGFPVTTGLPSPSQFRTASPRHGQEIRYVDIRVAIPADSPYPTPENLMGYLPTQDELRHLSYYQYPNQETTSQNPPPPPAFQPTVSNGSNRYISSPHATPVEESSSFGYHARPSTSSFTSFRPIPTSDDYIDIGATPSPSSPYSMAASPAPSLVCTTSESETPSESYCQVIAPHSMSPAVVAALAPPLYRRTSSTCTSSTSSAATASGMRGKSRTPAPLPKTPTGKKSPHTSKSNTCNTTEDQEEIQRKSSKIKTEICLHYANGRPCPWGANCTYAHGEEELQMTKLLDLHNAGLIDVKTFRTRPCFTWVATGSCPFGRRCAGIHDPRVIGSNASWLPHTETQGNANTTDINVDALHQKRLNELLSGNPFGYHFDLTKDEWSDLYKVVCNIDHSRNGWRSAEQRFNRRKPRGGVEHRKAGDIHPIFKLQIALELRGRAGWNFKFRPGHMIYEEMCMVIQKRAFRLITEDTADHDEVMRVEALPIRKYDPKLDSHVLVREIAFGPDSEESVHDVALYFNIHESDIKECTLQQTKRFRWKRKINSSSKQTDGSKSYIKKPSFDRSVGRFTMIRPHDEDAFDLATDMMKHRLAVLQSERIRNLKSRFEALQTHEASKKVLQDRFERQKKHWAAWSWPLNKGRDKYDETTAVPPVDGEYELSGSCSSSNSELLNDKKATHQQEATDCVNKQGSAARSLWKSFVSMDVDKINNVESPPTPTDTQNHVKIKSSHEIKPSYKLSRRLSIFEKLARGEEISVDRRLPHIRSTFLLHSNEGKDQDESFGDGTRQQERCWKALLLPSQQMHCTNEWQLVQDHFQKTRSKKVVAIVQDNSTTPVKMKRMCC